MSTYLVTGAAGFIGSAIASALVARGETVRGIDDLSTGSVDNLVPILDRMAFTVGDVRDQELLGQLCAGVDVIFHEAAIASVQQSIEDPIGTWDVNVEATRRLIVEARKAGVRRIVFASSSAIYGDTVCQPVGEDNRFRPMSPYANQKLACELMLREAHEESALETVCLRYFNVFGPRQSATSPYSGAIARFFHGMSTGAGDPVTIFGDGASTRDFVFIEDVVAANLAAASACGAEVSGRSFNIGTGQAQTIGKVAEVVRSLSGFGGSICNGPARLGEIRHSVADIRSAQQALGFEPATAFVDGLRKTHEWFCESRVGRRPARAVVVMPRVRAVLLEELLAVAEVA